MRISDWSSDVCSSDLDVEPVNQLVYANTGPGVPTDRVAKLTEAFEKAFAEPELIEQQKKLGIFISKIPAAEIIEVNKKVVALAIEFKSHLTDHLLDLRF